MADDDTSSETPWYDPAQTLSAGDPLRAWADRNIDWRTGRLLAPDPQKAIDSMISRGVAPPDVHADGTPSSVLALQGAGGNDVDPTTGMPIFGPDGRMQGNLTSAQGQPPQPVPSMPIPTPTPPRMPSAPVQMAAAEPEPASPLDPIPTPQERPKEAGPGASDLSARKKGDAAGAVSDFNKSLAGVKALAPPPLNAVGTPSVRSPTGISAPNIANLIALTQGTAPQSVAQTLGKLLVQGKA